MAKNLEKEKIEEILKEMESYLVSHGGGVELVKIEDFDIFLRVKGACVGCPWASTTFNLGLEQTLRERVPQIGKIIYVE